MWDVDLRTKTTSLHDSWPLADTRGACKHFLDIPVPGLHSLLEHAPMNPTKQLLIINNHSFSNDLEG